MPFKSKAQVRKFGAMAGRGEISHKKFREWVRATKRAGGFKRLPERVKRGKR